MFQCPYDIALNDPGHTARYMNDTCELEVYSPSLERATDVLHASLGSLRSIALTVPTTSLPTRQLGASPLKCYLNLYCFTTSHSKMGLQKAYELKSQILRAQDSADVTVTEFPVD